MSISRFAAVIKEDVNNEESIIIKSYSQVLKVMFKIILFLGVPYIAYLLFIFGNQS
ncbi:hypothetical protein [Bacillus sp. JJ1474]|uniref:hypothetical protein n=1 Tax=Bacillus sp. JJ1474 TaxID=3122955 RepID=UPI002FFDC78C